MDNLNATLYEKYQKHNSKVLFPETEAEMLKMRAAITNYDDPTQYLDARIKMACACVNCECDREFTIHYLFETACDFMCRESMKSEHIDTTLLHPLWLCYIGYIDCVHIDQAISCSITELLTYMMDSSTNNYCKYGASMLLKAMNCHKWTHQGRKWFNEKGEHVPNWEVEYFIGYPKDDDDNEEGINCDLYGEDI